jgi:poly(beta-D-mannuronate) C5 epimerase
LIPVKIFDNRVVQQSRCWAYRFLNVTGAAGGNTLNDEPFPIPLNLTTGFNGCWIE